MNCLDDPLSKRPTKNCIVLPKLVLKNNNGVSPGENENVNIRHNGNWDTSGNMKKSYKLMRPKPIDTDLGMETGIATLNMNSKDNFSFRDNFHVNSNTKDVNGGEGK